MSGNDQPGVPYGPPKKGKGLLIGIVALVVLLLVGGGVGTLLLVANSDDDDKSDEPATVSVEEHCAAMAEANQLILGSPTGDPQPVADAIEEAGITEDMTEDQIAGRQIAIRLISDASSYQELEELSAGFTEEETRQVNAFFQYYAANCTNLGAPGDSETDTTAP